MKSAYGDINSSKAMHTGGICTMLISPREWLLTDPVIDFETGRIISPVQLASGKLWLKLDLVPRDFYFEENEKSNKSGPYVEIIAGGILDVYNYVLQQMLETLRYCELAVIITDRNKRRKIVGNTQAGMTIRKFHRIKNNPAGEETIKMDMVMECEDPAPFYNPDNTPDAISDFLTDDDGNFVLIN